ncbi:MAG: hypothetical protein QOH21_2342 [Acidobacteriota bacterium]|nr:hypothetical protein [Acidobacteriota bacterium]
MSTLTVRPTSRPWKCASRFLSALLVLCAVLPYGAAAQETNDDLLLVAIRVDREMLSDSVSAYPLAGGLLLPLGELCRLLKFGITVDVEHQTAEGFFIDESRQFRLDVATQHVETNGTSPPIPPRKIVVLEDDIYVDAEVLATWFPFDARVDLFGAMVTIKPREKLPFQVERERALEIERTLRGLRTTGEAPPFVPNPYSLLAEPFVDHQLRIGYATDQSGPSMQYATLATGDLLGCEASFFITGNEQKPISELHGTLGRRDPNGQLLGFLHAREVAAGDVLLSANDLVTVTARGNGAVITNLPLQRAFAFDRQTLTGDLAPGWEVELYLNGGLIGFDRGKEGRYTFADVPVLYGLNVFRLVFHGPRGERRQKIETYNIGETLTPKGTIQYRAGSATPESQAKRALGELSYGVTRRLSIIASAVGLGETKELAAQQYATAGLRAAWGRVFTYADVGGSSTGGRIGRAGLQTRVSGVSVALTRAQLRNGYASEAYPSLIGLIKARTTMRLGGIAGARTRYPVPITVDVQRDDMVAGGTMIRAGNLVSASVRQMWISNRLEGVHVRDVDSPLAGNDYISGALLASRNIRGIVVRAEAGYDVAPRRRSTVTSVLVEWQRSRRFQVSAELSRNATNGISRLVTRLRRDRGRAGMTLAVDIPSRGAPSVHLELVTSLVPNPLTRRVQFRARPAAASGAVTARVFLDRNGNGIRDAGEPPIENAGFFVNRNSVIPTTNVRGIAMLDYLPAHTPTDVLLSTSTLEDPWWVPSRPAVRMVPRPGKALVVDFPVAVSGEITGTVYLDTGKGPRPAARIRMQVVNADGKVIAESPTEADGFYDLTKVPPGQYTLRVHPEDVATFHLAADAARPVTITVEKNVLDGIDVTLR